MLHKCIVLFSLRIRFVSLRDLHVNHVILVLLDFISVIRRRDKLIFKSDFLSPFICSFLHEVVETMNENEKKIERNDKK